MPLTLPVSEYCQNCQLDHADGSDGQLTPQFATHRPSVSAAPPTEGQNPGDT
jgi:hypothetical protein